VINSLDTRLPRRDAAVENLRADLPPDVTVYTISMISLRQARWQTAEGVTHESLSAHKDGGVRR